MRKTLTVAMVTSLALATAAQAKPKPNLVTKLAHSDNCTAVTGSDPEETILAAIAALLIEKAVTAGVKGLGKAMTKAGSPKDAHGLAYELSYFYRGDILAEPKLARFGRCLTIATGVQGGEGAVVGSEPGQTPGIRDDAVQFLTKWGFTKEPSYLMETRLVLSEDKSSYRLQPVFAWVGAPLNQEKAERDVVVTLSVTGPTATDPGDAISTRSFAFKRVKQGQVSPAVLKDMGSTWIPLPTLPEAAATRFAAAVQRKADIATVEKEIAELTAEIAKPSAPPRPPVRGAAPAPTPASTEPVKTPTQKKAEAEARLVKLNAASQADKTYLAKLMPVTFRVDVHETADGNKVLAAIGDFLTGNADAISKPIVDRLDPEKRAAAKETAATHEQTLRIAAIEAVEAWQEAEADAEVSAGQKRIKKMKAASACRALRNEDFDDEVCAQAD